MAFSETIKPIIDYFGEPFELERLKTAFSARTGSQFATNQVLDAGDVQRLVEVAIDYTDMSIEEVIDTIASVMYRQLPGNQYSDVVSIVEQFFFTGDN